MNDDVVLTELTDADSDRLFEWINHRQLVVLNAPFRPISREEHDAWFAAVRKDPSTRIFGIRLQGDNRLLGSCQLHHIHPSFRSAELQIRIGAEDARGRGLGTQAVRKLLEFGFAELDLRRIYLHVFATNEPALKLYRRVGMTTEGRLREAALIEGEWVDVVVMAMLRHEFDALQ